MEECGTTLIFVLFSENLALVKLFLNQETIDARIKNFIFQHLEKYYHNFLTETVGQQETVEMQQSISFFVLLIEQY